MAIAGNIRDMSLPTLMQSIIQDGGVAAIELLSNEHIGLLHICEGELFHAHVTHQTDKTTSVAMGEMAVYELLQWHDAEFRIERGIDPLPRSINQSWDFLLMEGLRQLDETEALNLIDVEEREDEDVSLADMLSDLSAEDAAMIEALAAQSSQSDDEMAGKRAILQAILRDVIKGSSDLLGAVVVDHDGSLLASVISGALDGNRVAAISAGLISLASRSAQQLGQGEVIQTLIKAENGNIIALRAGSFASFVALTPMDANLGMAFIECQNAAAEVAKTI